MVINNAKQYIVDWYLWDLFKGTRKTTEHRSCEKLLYNKKAFKICFWIHDDKSSSVFCSYFFIFLKIVANNFAMSKILKCSGNTLRAPNQFWFFSADAMLPAVLNASLSSKVMLICIPADMRLNTVLQNASAAFENVYRTCRFEAMRGFSLMTFLSLTMISALLIALLCYHKSENTI